MKEAKTAKKPKQQRSGGMKEAKKAKKPRHERSGDVKKIIPFLKASIA